MKMNENGVTSKWTLILPHAGEKSCSTTQTQLKRSLPNNVKPIYHFYWYKTNFNLEDPVTLIEKHDIIYRSICETESYNEDYVSE